MSKKEKRRRNRPRKPNPRSFLIKIGVPSKFVSRIQASIDTLMISGGLTLIWRGIEMIVPNTPEVGWIFIALGIAACYWPIAFGSFVAIGRRKALKRQLSLLILVAVLFCVTMSMYAASKSYDLKTYYNTNKAELISKYPFGFEVFYVGKHFIFAPRAAAELYGLRIDWESAKVLGIKDNRISFRLPNVHGQFRNSELRFIGNTVTVPLSERSKFQPVGGIFGPAEMWVEVVSSEPSSVICVIGFSENKSIDYTN